MSGQDVFIVADESTTSTTTAPAPGFWERKCDACGSEWGPTACTKTGCSSVIFSETYHKPTPFFSGLREKFVPKAAPPRATADQKRTLRAFVSRLERVCDDLPQINEMARAAVADGIEELAPAHNVLHQATYTSGDISIENVRMASLAVRALTSFLDRAVRDMEDNP